MKKEIESLIYNIKLDIEKLGVELEEKASKISKLQLIVLQLEEILQKGE